MEGDWRKDSACRGIDPELFYPERGESVEEALRFCAVCPVTEQCLQYAMDNFERRGIWGGTTGRERRRIRLGLPPRELLPCGTPAAYQRHLKNGTKPCAPCKEANARRIREANYSHSVNKARTIAKRVMEKAS